MSATRIASAAPRPRDAGLQVERTALSWNRTGLTVLANALLVLRTGWTSGEVSLTVVAFALLVAAGAAIFYGGWRRRHLLKGHGMTAPPALVIAVAAVVTLVACATGIASILVHT